MIKSLAVSSSRANHKLSLLGLLLETYTSSVKKPLIFEESEVIN